MLGLAKDLEISKTLRPIGSLGFLVLFSDTITDRHRWDCLERLRSLESLKGLESLEGLEFLESVESLEGLELGTCGHTFF